MKFHREITIHNENMKVQFSLSSVKIIGTDGSYQVFDISKIISLQILIINDNELKDHAKLSFLTEINHYMPMCNSIFEMSQLEQLLQCIS